LYCQGYDSNVLTQDLGKKFYSDRTFKPYPACRFTHGVIECALKITHQHDIDADNIREIKVGVTDTAAGVFVSQPFKINEFPQATATFSLQYTTASTLIRKSIKLEHFTEDSIRDKKVGDLAKKVKIIGSIPPDKPLGTELEVIMKNGAKFSTSIEVPRGDSNYNPLTENEIKEKFKENVAFSRKISEKKGAKVLKMLESLEKLDNLTKVVNEII
jgi:2-methylcitrate dehydratase PrpD